MHYALCVSLKNEKGGIEMKAKIILLVLALAFVLGFYGIAKSGDGPTDPACSTLPNPTAGPFLLGAFSVAYDKSEYSLTEPALVGHYNVHIALKRFNQTHLFSFPASVPNQNLCTFTASDFKAEFAKHPCKLGFGQAFGLSGTPVIVDLVILKRDFCDSPPVGFPYSGFDNVPVGAMVLGDIIIRVVP
jgi:hypothetical protein